MTKCKLLYLLGFSEFRAYPLKNWKSDSPSLKLENSCKIPLYSGYDLSKLSDNELIVTAEENVGIFNIITQRFSQFEPLNRYKDIKYVNYSPKNGQLVYAVAENNW